MMPADQPVKRVVGPARQALDGASVLPIQRRAVVDSVFIPALDRALARPHVVAIVADAGLGKSVLLGQLFDELEKRPTIAPILVSSGAVAGPVSDADGLDRALGAAARVAPRPITYLAEDQRAHKWQPILLLDTIDLLLDERSVPILADFLRRLVEVDVPAVITCRQFEFDTFLQPIEERAPLLANVLTPEPLFGLKRQEVQTFVSSYLRDHLNIIGDGRSVDSFVEKLLHLREKRHAIVEICRSPLLLSLVCKIYAPEGEVPEDLTVSLLYSNYWDRYVRGDRIRSAREAAERERYCLRAAAWLLTNSKEAFVEDFPETVGANDDDEAWRALEGLRSSAVIVRGVAEARLRFFHQTLAEYAIAQYTVDSPEARDALIQNLSIARQDSHLWPVAIQLLFAAARRGDRDTLMRIVERLDLAVLHALRAVVLVAVACEDPVLLDMAAHRALALSAQHQQLVAEATTGCSESFAHHSATLLRDMLVHSNPGATFTIARVLGIVIARIENDRAFTLAQAVAVVLAVRDEVTGRPSRRDALVETFVAGLQDATLNEPDGAILLEAYKRCGPLARTKIIHLLMRAPLDMRTAVLSVATRYQAPSAGRDELIALVRRVLNESVAAATFGWTDWRAMLASQYPDGWEDVQCATLVTEATESGSFGGSADAQEVIAMCSGAESLLRRRAIFVAQAWAPRQPELFVEGLSIQPSPDHRSAASAARAILMALPILSASDATRLVDWLSAAIETIPNILIQAWAFAAKGHPDLLAGALGSAAQYLSGRDRDKVVSAVLEGCPAGDGQILQPELERLLGMPGRSTELTARASGMLAPIDASWRSRCREFALGTAPVPSHARAAVSRLYESATALDWFDERYFAELFNCTVPGVVETMAELISLFQQRGRPLTILLADAIREALRNSRSAPVSGAVFDVIEADIREDGILAPQLHEILDELVSRAETTIDEQSRGGDNRTTIARSALTLLRYMLLRGDDRAERTGLLVNALRRLPLDGIRHVDDDIHRLATLAEREMPGSLASLIVDLPAWPPSAQIGFAKAVREVHGSASAAFRQLAAVDGIALEVQQFVVRHLE